MKQNGKAGIGGVVGDGGGNRIFVYAVLVKCQNHNVVEAMAAKYAAQWIKNANLKHCTIELDSSIVDDMLRNKTSNNLILKPIMKRPMR
ncbi:hypothetical protein T459_16547 [Capsicum annuum]|uniref:RNase H type-1 domain-containing protein n=1 Tax=Capsicum annuum TaxID=4072 RepID=A0A2G2Z9E4_CAPAN|nr:hypothetical protein T459_16547 [Capsicum annuum]